MNENNANKYNLTLNNYQLYEKTDINGNTYYLVIDNNKAKEEGNGYFCFTLKSDSPNYPGLAFTNLNELHLAGYKENDDSLCKELRLEILEFVGKNGRDIRKIIKAEWDR